MIAICVSGLDLINLTIFSIRIFNSSIVIKLFTFILFYSTLAAVISIVVIRNYAKKLQENEGKQLPVFSISISLFVILPLIAFLIGGVSLSFEVPVLKQIATTSFIYEGGLGLPPELIALTLALALYTATFIAECVRAGIQGISKGQKEAAPTKGLTPNQVLK